MKSDGIRSGLRRTRGCRSARGATEEDAPFARRAERRPFSSGSSSMASRPTLRSRPAISASWASRSGVVARPPASSPAWCFLTRMRSSSREMSRRRAGSLGPTPRPGAPRRANARTRGLWVRYRTIPPFPSGPLGPCPLRRASPCSPERAVHGTVSPRLHLTPRTARPQASTFLRPAVLRFALTGLADSSSPISGSDSGTAASSGPATSLFLPRPIRLAIAERISV